MELTEDSVEDATTPKDIISELEEIPKMAALENNDETREESKESDDINLNLENREEQENLEIEPLNVDHSIEIENFDLEPTEEYKELEIPVPIFEDVQEQDSKNIEEIPLEELATEKKDFGEEIVLEMPDLILKEEENISNQENYPIETTLVEEITPKEESPILEMPELSLEFPKIEEANTLEELSTTQPTLSPITVEETPKETTIPSSVEETALQEMPDLSLEFPKIEEVNTLEELSTKQPTLSPITVEEITPQEMPQLEQVKEIAQAEIPSNDTSSVSKVKPVAISLEEKKESLVETTQIDPAITEKINQIENNNNTFGVGKIVNIKEFIIEVVGLEDVSFYEKINIANKALGYVTKIETSSVFIAILDKKEDVVIGDLVYQTNEEYTGYFSEDAMGRIINLFGVDELTDKKFTNQEKIRIEEDNIPIMDRTAVNRPLLTGIVGIDLIYPIGRGQRQLIIGDKKTGKTQICLDTIANQQGKNVICIYCAIGKTKKEIKQIYQELVKKGAMPYTIIITAFNDDSVPVLVLTPFYALSVARKYMMKGYDVLVVLDDLKRHGDAYREISLIAGKSPGRDAYPSDIFYLHSRLLEKGCQYKNGASITILPVVETRGGDITDYISTNIISITDGQIVLSAKNFQKGEKPAINYGLSVSRLGGAVQTREMKSLGAKVRLKLLSYLDTREVYELANIDEMSPELQAKIFEGKKILEQLVQSKYSPKSEEEIKNQFTFLGEKQNG